MIQLIKKIFGIAPKVNFSLLIKNGAMIVDVRTKQEFAQGHVKGAKNIPLQNLKASLHLLKNLQQPIITCCASGMRSANAKSILKSCGYTQVYNGGGWVNLQQKIKNEQ